MSSSGGSGGTGLGTGIGIDNIIVGKGPTAPLADVNLTELANTSGSTIEQTAMGTIDFTDVDLTNIGHMTTITAVTATGSINGLGTNADVLAYLDVSTVKLGGEDSGSISWTFAARDGDFDYLAAG